MMRQWLVRSMNWSSPRISVKWGARCGSSWEIWWRFERSVNWVLEIRQFCSVFSLLDCAVAVVCWRLYSFGCISVLDGLLKIRNKAKNPRQNVIYSSFENEKRYVLKILEQSYRCFKNMLFKKSLDGFLKLSAPFYAVK